MFKFIKNIIKSTISTIKDFIVDIFKNAESVVILSLGAVGCTSILTEIPFHYALPLWIETPLIIPVISVFIVYGLASLMNWRMSFSYK
jgi:hypothetical protein